MPRKPSKFIERGGGETLSEEQVQDLLFGRELLSGLTEAFPHEAARRKAFKKYESELLKRFVERYPGSRPPLWWELSAPGERQKIGEASLLVVILGTIIYFMYQWIDDNNKRTRADIDYLKEEVTKCRDDNQEILLETNRNYIKVIEKNNEYLKELR